MFVFQSFREQRNSKPTEEERPAVANVVAKQFKVANPEFKKDTEGLDERRTLEVAMSSKYHDKFKEFFIQTAGKSQWEQFEQYYTAQMAAAQAQRQADQRNIASLRGLKITKDIAGGQAYVEKATQKAKDEFYQPPQTG